MRKLNRYRSSIARILTALISWFIPKHRGAIAFTSLFHDGRFYGNSQALFAEAIKSHPDWNIFWVAHPDHAERPDSVPSQYWRIAKTFWSNPINKAEFVVVDGIDPFLAVGRYKFIQLWHGGGFKNIGYTNHKRNFTSRTLTPYFCKSTLLMTSNSNDDMERKRKSFGIANIVVTGSPKNDALFAKSALNHEMEINQRFKSIKGRRILYAPTFRDANPDFNPLSRAGWAELDEKLRDSGDILILKRHPRTSHFNIPNNLRCIVDVTADFPDIQVLFLIADVFITDYSSAVTDFSLTGKPIVFYCPDLAEYKKTSRSFYYQVPECFPGPIVESEGALFALLSGPDWHFNTVYKNEYTRFRKRFHEFTDGYSSKRILTEIDSLVYSRGKSREPLI
jgi:CDP-glycerol glycerophosphotransferase